MSNSKTSLCSACPLFRGEMPGKLLEPNPTCIRITMEGRVGDVALLLLLNRATRQGELVLAVASVTGVAGLLIQLVFPSL